MLIHLVMWVIKALTSTDHRITAARDSRAARRRAYPPMAGLLVSVLAEENAYAVMKVLVVEPRGVHVRLYVERFKRRPTRERQLKTLTVLKFRKDLPTPFSADHMALKVNSYDGWKPEWLSESSVTNDELRAYDRWRRTGDGYV